MRKLDINFITSGNDSEKSVLVAWDFDERLYKKIHFIAQAVFKKHDLKPVEMKSPWPHISAAYIKGVLTPDERHKFVLAANAIKPKFKFKQFDILSGKDFDYLVLEFFVPVEFKKFEDFAEDICGKERISKYAETRPHVSIWAVEKKDTSEFKKILPEIKEETKKYLWSFVPTKVSFWVDFEIDEIASIAFLMQEPSWYARVKSKYELVVAEQADVWYHGRTVDSEVFDLKYVGRDEAKDQEGIGFYFTKDKDDASGYAAPNGVVLTVELKPRKLVSLSQPAKGSDVDFLIDHAPDLEGTLSNWDENPTVAKRKAKKAMLASSSAKETFESIWFDFYKSEPKLFLEKMISLGYDGHQASRTEKHIIIYNPKAIKVIKKEHYNKVGTQAKIVLSSTTEDVFYTRNKIDPDDLCFAGSGDFGEAYHAGKKRILKKTTSKSEYEFAKKIMNGHYPSFVKIYDVDEVKDGTTHHSYFILQDELNIDQDDESMFHQLSEMLDTQGVPIAYISHFDESEYEEKIDDNMLEFINDISEIVRSYNRLGIESPDIRSENLGRDKQGRLLAFDVDEKKR